jgi:hypothetical protein
LINGGLVDIKLENECVIKLREGLIDSLNKRFKYVFDNNLFIASTFINYNFKKFEFIFNNDERANLTTIAKQYILDLHKLKLNNDTASILPAGAHSTTTPTSSQSATLSLQLANVSNDTLIIRNSKRKLNKVHSILSKIQDKPIDLVNEKSSLEIEIENYEKCFFTSNDNFRDDDAPLFFFRQNKTSYPNLGAVAKIIFSIPVTSVPSESLFSQAGETQNDLRNRLKATNLERLTFCKNNRLGK